MKKINFLPKKARQRSRPLNDPMKIAKAGLTLAVGAAALGIAVDAYKSAKG